MKKLIFTIIGVVGLTAVSMGQWSPPSYLQITNSAVPQSGFTEWTSSGSSWDQTYMFSETTTDALRTKPIGSSRSDNAYMNFPISLLPQGTKYHIFGTTNTMTSGIHTGKPLYSLVIAELPDGSQFVLSTAKLEEDGTRVTYTEYMGPNEYDYGVLVERAGTPSLVRGDDPNRFAVLYEGGGFGPGYDPSMALPLSTGGASGAVISSAIELNKGLTFQGGQWTPEEYVFFIAPSQLGEDSHPCPIDAGVTFFILLRQKAGVIAQAASASH